MMNAATQDNTNIGSTFLVSTHYIYINTESKPECGDTLLLHHDAFMMQMPLSQDQLINTCSLLRNRCCVYYIMIAFIPYLLKSAAHMGGSLYNPYGCSIVNLLHAQ